VSRGIPPCLSKDYVPLSVYARHIKKSARRVAQIIAQNPKYPAVKDPTNGRWYIYVADLTLR